MSHRISKLGQGQIADLHVLYTSIIPRFPCVEPLGHDDSPNEGTATFFGTIFIIFPSPQNGLGGHDVDEASNDGMSQQHHTYPQQLFVTYPLAVHSLVVRTKGA